MYASIFFYMKCIYGDSSLLKALLSGMLDKTRKNAIFQSYMASNAQHYQPPLGFFRHFILDKNGLNHKALNLKTKGVVPIIDFARVYALSSAVSVVNTQDRLRELIDQKGLSGSGGRDLIEAYSLLILCVLNIRCAKLKRDVMWIIMYCLKRYLHWIKNILKMLFILWNKCKVRWFLNIKLLCYD
nr:putative nucleotidyltransferase substrate binding domain-containing protein [Abyssogena phaseoliformis symbiont]